MITERNFMISVNYDRSLRQMIAVCDCVYNNPSITTDHFPFKRVSPLGDPNTGTVDVEIILVHFDRYISSKDAVAKLEQMGLEPARVEHAMAFGEKYPDIQRGHPVIFLGSVWDDAGNYCGVPYLDHWRDRRELHLRGWNGEWSCNCLFAAVRNVPVAVV